jgi:hypothetical protein
MTLPTIFVSHSSKEDAFGTTLATDLRRAWGEDDAVWFEPRAGRRFGGDSQWYRLLRQILDRPIFLPILSPTWVASLAYRNEFYPAFDQWKHSAGKLIVPVFYQPCEPFADILHFQAVSFIDRPYEQACDELLARLWGWSPGR